MSRAVVLRHDLPDGSHHFDWLIERSPGEEPHDRALIAWRLPTGPGGAEGAYEAVRLPPHRRMYLEYEGPVSGDRGSVTRIASGDADILADGPDRFAAILRFGDLELSLTGAPAIPPSWTLRLGPRRDRA